MALSTHERALAFAKSYDAAMQMMLKPNASLEACAAALVSHYATNVVCFVSGHTVTLPPTSDGQHPWLKGVEDHLKRFEKSGLGCKIWMAANKIEAYSEGPTGSAQCWITWKIEPRPESGIESWEWQNIYAWRANGEEDKGRWEYMVSDHEVQELAKRVPHFTTIEV